MTRSLRCSTAIAAAGLALLGAAQAQAQSGPAVYSGGGGLGILGGGGGGALGGGGGGAIGGGGGGVIGGGGGGAIGSGAMGGGGGGVIGGGRHGGGHSPVPRVVSSGPLYSPYRVTPLTANPYLPAALAGNLYTPGYSGLGYSYGSYGSSMDPLGSGLYGYGYSLQGMASLTQSTGQYEKDMQTAALSREGLRQAALDTERRRIEFAMWQRSMQPTPLKMAERVMATELGIARRSATPADILSGKALNALLGQIRSLRVKQHRGPLIPIEESILKRLNVAPAGAAGNVGLLKDGGKLSWPVGLQSAIFDEPRKRLSRNVLLAVQTLRAGDPVSSNILKDIRGDHKAILDLLDAGNNDLSPTEQIEAYRYLTQLLLAIRVLADAKAVNFFNGNWAAKGKDAAELCDYMIKEGLVFTPAGEGDEAASAYQAVYQAVRTYEAGLQTAEN